MMLKVFEMGFYVFMWVGKHLGINFDFFWWTWDSYQSWDLCFVLSWGSFWYHRLDDLVNLQNGISWPLLSLPKFASKKKKDFKDASKFSFEPWPIRGTRKVCIVKYLEYYRFPINVWTLSIYCINVCWIKFRGCSHAMPLSTMVMILASSVLIHFLTWKQGGETVNRLKIKFLPPLSFSIKYNLWNLHTNT